MSDFPLDGAWFATPESVPLNEARNEITGTFSHDEAGVSGRVDFSFRLVLQE